AKSELAEALPPSGLLVLNADDPLLWPMNRNRPVRKRSYGLDNADADLRPTRVDQTAAGGTRFSLPGGPDVQLALLGRHNVRNALAALLVGDEFGVPRAAAAGALAAMEPPKHRLELLQAGGISILDDAYNANPSSMAEALAARCSGTCWSSVRPRRRCTRKRGGACRPTRGFTRRGRSPRRSGAARHRPACRPRAFADSTMSPRWRPP